MSVSGAFVCLHHSVHVRGRTNVERLITGFGSSAWFLFRLKHVEVSTSREEAARTLELRPISPRVGKTHQRGCLKFAASGATKSQHGRCETLNGSKWLRPYTWFEPTLTEIFPIWARLLFLRCPTMIIRPANVLRVGTPTCEGRSADDYKGKGQHLWNWYTKSRLVKRNRTNGIALILEINTRY